MSDTEQRFFMEARAQAMADAAKVCAEAGEHDLARYLESEARMAHLSVEVTN